MKKKPKIELTSGETAYIAQRSLTLNRGRVKVNVGDLVILGEDDIKDGINITNLLKAGAIKPAESENTQVEEEKEGLTDG